MVNTVTIACARTVFGMNMWSMKGKVIAARLEIIHKTSTRNINGGDMMPLATIELNGKKYEFALNEKKFSTGSTGYHGHGKIEVSEDEKYQVNLMLVRIGSKNKK